MLYYNLMFLSFEIRQAWLKAISTLLLNLAAGIILLLFTIRDLKVLTLDLLLAIICIIIAVKIEEILEVL